MLSAHVALHDRWHAKVARSWDRAIHGGVPAEELAVHQTMLTRYRSSSCRQCLWLETLTRLNIAEIRRIQGHHSRAARDLIQLKPLVQELNEDQLRFQLANRLALTATDLSRERGGAEGERLLSSAMKQVRTLQEMNDQRPRSDRSFEVAARRLDVLDASGIRAAAVRHVLSDGYHKVLEELDREEIRGQAHLLLSSQQMFVDPEGAMNSVEQGSALLSTAEGDLFKVFVLESRACVLAIAGEMTLALSHANAALALRRAIGIRVDNDYANIPEFSRIFLEDNPGAFGVRPS